MPRPDNVGNLSPEEWVRVEEMLDRYEEAARASASADLAQFLPTDQLRPLVLCELIKSDLEIRWRRGEQVLVEEYLRRFPELTEESNWLPPLLYEEYLVRCRHGDSPALNSYRDRFPSQFAALEQQARERPTQTVASPPPPPPVVEDPVPAPAAQRGGGDVLPVGGGYKLHKRLGAGAFGEVWHAEAPGGVDVALKIVHRPLDHEEAQRELQALALVKNIRHSFLIQTQAFWTLDDRLVISLELAEGSLRDRLKACVKAGKPGIPVVELLRYLRNASEAMDFLHAREVLHRDIKPENILLVGPHAKLADFGLARRLMKKSSFTATLCGSMPYMAPEIWLGRAGPHSDQYSLAATYAELRLNRTLFPHGALVGLMDGQSGQQLDLEPLPQAEQQVLLRALSREPEKRFGSCLEMCEALETAAAVRVAPVPAYAGHHGPATPAPATRLLPDSSDGMNSLLPPSGEPNQPGSMYVTIRDREPPAVPRRDATGKSSGWRSAVPKGRASSWTGTLLIGACVLLLAGLIALPWCPIWPSARAVYLPEGGAWQAAGLETQLVEGKHLYKRIRRLLPDENKTPIDFILMAGPDLPEDMPPFYMMETKVTNRMFSRFALERSEAIEKPDWRKGGQANGTDLGSDGDQLDWPVYRITADEAHAFARWVGGERGDLPTARQWDAAGGKFLGQPGPFAGGPKVAWNPGEFALAAAASGGRPLPVRTATRDIVVGYGFRDMASNGQEWTSTQIRNSIEGASVSWDIAAPESQLSLRGMSYHSTAPYEFLVPPVLEPLARDKRSSEISFRVALNLPPLADLP